MYHTHIHNLALVYLSKYHCSPSKEAGVLHATCLVTISCVHLPIFVQHSPLTYSNLLLPNTLISYYYPLPQFWLKTTSHTINL